MAQAPQARRVVVAMDEAAEAGAALDVAIRLAAAFDAQLTALFLENADLVRAAQLPFVRETGAHSGGVRPMAVQAVLRALRTGADQARAAVAAGAQASGLDWQFDVVHARRFAYADIVHRALDLLVFPHRPAYAPRDGLPGASRQTAGETRPVAVALRDVPAAADALDVGRALSTALEAPLLLLAYDGGTSARFATQCEARTPARPAPMVVHATLREWSAEAIAAAARLHHARLLVWPGADLARETPHVLHELLTRLRCPLIVAG